MVIPIDYRGNEVKIGDLVSFKVDIEGEGVIADIRYFGFFNDYVDFVVVSEKEPNGYPFHSMAIFDHKVNAMAVITDRVWLRN